MDTSLLIFIHGIAVGASFTCVGLMIYYMLREDVHEFHKAELLKKGGFQIFFKGYHLSNEEISQLIEALGQRKDLDLTERIFQLTNGLNAKKK